MFVYEKNGKLNFEFDNHNQVPTTPDVTISKEGCVVESGSDSDSDSNSDSDSKS